MINEHISTQSVSAKLRAIRNAQGYSLSEVEVRSHGRIKAVVLGSYERGSRSMSVSRAIEIAHFYGVPPFSLFLDKSEEDHSYRERMILDLREIKLRIEGESGSRDVKLERLARFTISLLHARQDWNGEVISIRNSDLDNLGLIIDLENTPLLNWLEDEKFLLRKAVKS